MFSRKIFIFVLFVGQLVSSDNKSENKFQNWSNAFDKKAVISLGVGIVGSLISEKCIFLPHDTEGLDGLFSTENVPEALTLIAANLKLIPFFMVKRKEPIISFKNG